MKLKEKPPLYSYTRFSSPAQEEGDSLRRQLEAAEKFAESKGFTLDEGLRMTDKGLSGFHGMHRKKGALGAFLEKVKSGEVQSGSILLVENMDRLSREPYLTAMETVIDLLKSGITIQTLNPPDSYTTASVNNNGFWRLVAHIDRANGESQRKSQLAQANWRQKRKLAPEKILTRRAPAWLRVVDGRFERIPEAAETVQQIFKLKLDGFGKFTIEKKLNEMAPWSPESGWRASYIEKILRTRAVLGEFQPHRLDDQGKRVPDGDALAGYFPPVIDLALWHAVQSRMAGNKGKGGKTGKAGNVFQNLVRCGYCGGPMTFIDKGDWKALVCDNGRRGVKGEDGQVKCRAHSVEYGEFEETMLDNLSKLRPETVLPNSDEQSAQAKLLRDAFAGLAGELKDTETRIANLLEQIETTTSASFRTRYEQRAEELEAKQKELEAERVKKEAALHELERGGQSFDKWQKDLAGLKKAIANDVDTRVRLKAHLKEFIAKVDVFAKGHGDDVEHAIALVEEYMPEVAAAKSYPAFKAYLSKRLLSTEGKCYRLHLRNARPDSQGLQIAPESSLASRVSIQPGADGWKFSGPKLEMLCNEFFDRRKPGQFEPKGSVL